MRQTQVARQHDRRTRRGTRNRCHGRRRGEGSGFALLLDNPRILLRWRDIEHPGYLMNRLFETYTFLAAADAGVAAADRPVVLAGVAEADRRTVGISFRPLATQLVKAVALTMTGITEFHGKTPGVEVSATLAVLVDQARVGKLGTAQLV